MDMPNLTNERMLEAELRERFHAHMNAYNLENFIDCDDFYVAITGLRKETYHGILGVGVYAYARLYDNMGLSDVLGHYGYRGTVSFQIFDASRRVILIFSPTDRPAVSVPQLMENITEYIQSFYDEHLYPTGVRYPNTTAWCKAENGLHSLPDALDRVNALHELSFFVTEPTVFTDDWLAAHQTPLSVHSLVYELRGFDLSLLSGSLEKNEAALRELFMGKLKASASLSLCRDALLYIKSLFELYDTVYGIERAESLDTLFSIATYPSIDACCEAMLRLLRDLYAHIAENPISSKAILVSIYYIRHHFAEASLSLSDIAAYTNLNANYLSTLFKQQMGVSIRQFITQVRISHARKLLAESAAPLEEIAARCGFANIQYFAQVFRSAAGKSPAAFRQESLLI